MVKYYKIQVYPECFDSILVDKELPQKQCLIVSINKTAYKQSYL